MIREQAATSSPDYEACNGGNHGFVIGLLAGGVVGASLGWMFAPRISSAGRQVAASLNDLRTAASTRYDEASARVTAAVDDLSEKGDDLRDQVSDAVIHGARSVEHRAEQMKSGR